MYMVRVRVMVGVKVRVRVRVRVKVANCFTPLDWEPPSRVRVRVAEAYII